MDNFVNKIWADEMGRILTQRIDYAKMFIDKSPPPPWHIAQWNLLRARVRDARQWLGEKIAGRKFDEWYY